MSDMTAYTVAWICAISTELVAAKQFLDEAHDDADQLAPGDDNAYVLGKVGRHNIVITVLPHGQYGLVSAAIVTRDMARSFPNLRFALMVGIGGGAPSQRHDIRLGDIVVSSPGSGLGGVLQYDFGKTVQDESFEVTGHLNQSPQCLLRAIPLLEADYKSDGNGIDTKIIRVLEKKPLLRAEYGKPDSSADKLFSSAYKHAGDKYQECIAVCIDASQLVVRTARPEGQNGPKIHFGLIASANQLMKDAKMRDRLSSEKNVLCFEMEAAGLMNHIPCLVIRGICDYSDTHKNKVWQGYAAMAAAAYAKDLLCKVVPNKIAAERKLVDVLSDIRNEVAKTKSAIQDEARRKERRDQDEKDEKCLCDLFVTNPRDDKKRIEETKGGLLEGSYSWILTNDDFNQFRNDQETRLLWIKGDPGKGKTMLLCGIIDDLEKSLAEGKLLSYFFCQATDKRINTATSVLRGLISMLIDQDASLVSYLRKRYETTGKALFEEPNARQALTEIFIDMLQNTKLQEACLMVDALDECAEDLPQLLDLIVQTAQFPHTKWLVSSRNWVEIEEKLCDVAHRLSLELNAKSVSAAVESYITHKVSHLKQKKRYSDTTVEEVRQYLSANAHGTFLWVALVCQELEKTRQGKALQKVKTFPPGLNALYARMMQKILASEDAELCTQMLALIATTYRPPSLAESITFIEEDDSTVEDAESLKEIVGLCGSFLTVRGETVYFVHQSAKDFLMKEQSAVLFPEYQTTVHIQIFSKSMEAMSQTLERDIYDLRNPGYPIDKVTVPSPDPLASIKYSCVYWIDHVQDAGDIIQTGIDGRSVVTDILKFLKTTYLHWIEALSLMHNIPDGVKAMQKLERVLAKTNSKELRNLAKDTCRFLLSQKGGIELAPLQTYTSALIFSPINSLDQQLFHKESPDWIDLAPKIEEDWSACLQTLEGHSHSVESVTFSPDGRRLASGSDDKTVKLWDAESGACLQTLEGHSYVVTSVAFSTDGRRLASGSTDNTVKLWDAESADCLQTINVSRAVQYLSFDPGHHSYLSSDVSDIIFDPSYIDSTPLTQGTLLTNYYLTGHGISADNLWITYKGDNSIWLPPDYRPSTLRIAGPTIAIGCRSGRVWVIRFAGLDLVKDK